MRRAVCHVRLFSVSKPLNPVTVAPSAAAAAPFNASRTSPAPATHWQIFGSFLARCVSSSSLNSYPALERDEPIPCSEFVGKAGVGGIDLDPASKPSIPVRAYFFSTSVDLKGLMEQNKLNFIPPASRMTNHAVLKFGDLSRTNEECACLSGSNCCYMVVFQYGSIVLFNVPGHEVEGYLKIVERHASELLPETEIKKDEYEVREQPTLSTWMQGGMDHIVLQSLNIDGIRTIGRVLGQSIALDYYVRQVDELVAEFTDINRGMEKTGTFKMEKKKLFQLVGKANNNLTDVILKLGFFERKKTDYLEVPTNLDFCLCLRITDEEIKSKNDLRNGGRHVKTSDDSFQIKYFSTLTITGQILLGRTESISKYGNF